MRLILTLFLIIFLKNTVAAEERWCSHIGKDGTVLEETICQVEFEEFSACELGLLDGDYKLSFSNTSSVRIENKCSEDGYTTVVVDDNAAFVSETSINGSIYYEVYFMESDERFIFEPKQIDKEMNYNNANPPWSKVRKKFGLAGECYFLGSDTNDDLQTCKQYTECNRNDESGEGSCLIRHFFENGGSINFSQVEDYCNVVGTEFEFSCLEILKSYSKTCYPFDESGKLFCYKNIGSDLELIEVDLSLAENIPVLQQLLRIIGNEQPTEDTEFFGKVGIVSGNALLFEVRANRELAKNNAFIEMCYKIAKSSNQMRNILSCFIADFEVASVLSRVLEDP
jgi:hypothetical protein